MPTLINKIFLYSTLVPVPSLAWMSVCLLQHRSGVSLSDRPTSRGLRESFSPLASTVEAPTVETLTTTSKTVSPLSLSLEELASIVNGRGRAQAIWSCYRNGVDPCRTATPTPHYTPKDGLFNHSLEEMREPLVGVKARNLLTDHFVGALEDTVASVVDESVSADGTRKLLIQLREDGLRVETVIIPWEARGQSTLCVSSQVGCRQACTFCMTGRMGKLRSLSTDEILAQVFLAIGICRREAIYPIDNIVFMGMGEPADNAENVVRAAHTLTNPLQFQFAPRRITISTIAPTPETFQELGTANVALAWSVHSSRDAVRKQLVPTTLHSMVELCEGLISELLCRSRRQRSTMLEYTLLHEINDSTEDANHLADFCQPLIDRVPSIKLVVNVIPWNDISASVGPAAHYQRSSDQRIREFQQVLVSRGILCYVRITRGDEEKAACGQLATRTS